uniref:phosphatidylinositol 3,4,5-trisphosphate 5-phosphatase 1 n=1 Tax=Doryrhamphus excisus TaxID=161450 RepID=UPI0025AEA328|nr:phosphatidylinositol 3,4,5-trisphosphate 5-phosphatase 1 [Doryrhamphus excisus]XP_057929530.1 phosphatidylinositol 3,4,5-trisphosphate 5-phosphatase 1 [Doryrhamphus excisus]XP_057929531.1 phosphatidylinositol 3,4,5-trisphosphate 5-phosphatase 1 [Doryrhamphus excisus]XP_057929532.1 phosphatidylinositol 3,4,5-trisphosphate 5-phosphatase 1 [Doryrhamphus excisus]
MQSCQAWCHGNITRSKTEDLLSKAGRDGSFLIRDSESIQGAFALCVLFQKCVYTYRILSNEDKKLSVQASEGVPIRFFSMLPELVEAYHNPNMGLVTHLQYAVQREEEPEEEPESKNPPPQLPPRNLPAIDVKEGLSDTFLMRLQHMDMSMIAEEQQVLILDYFRTTICLDAEQAQNGNLSLPGLKKLTMAICKNLNGEISRVLPALEACQRTLDQQLSPGIGPHPKQISADPGHAVSFRLEQLTKLLYSIEDKAKNAVFESVGYDGGHRKSLIPPVVFEVKQESLGIPTKMFMKVDVEGGKLHFKKLKDGPDDKYFVHNKIRQLVKSQKMQAKLVIVVETEKEKILRKEFVFDNAKKREGFCQLLQQMKNKHSEKPEPDMITVFVGTWNMGNASPPHNTNSWFQCKGQGKTQDDTADHIPHDIYVIGTQEDPLGEREWVDTVKSVLRNITNISFKQVAIHTLWNTRIVVLAKPEHENRISHVFSDSVKTGIANTLGNKGAVGVSFMFNGTSFGFVNSHLTSGSEKKLRRNQNYLNILRFLNLGDKKVNPFDITHRFTHLFWLGDLNYRLDLPNTEAEYIVSKIKQQQYQELLCRDQLTMERNDQKVFLHFAEEEITFAPTYRFERYTRDKYAYTKAKATGTKYNLPSWCDRILWKSYPLVHVVCQAYGCTNDIMTSDHSPVFASFEVGVASQFVSKRDPDNAPQGGIQIMNCKATLLTKSKTKFFIEYHSSCLEKTVRTCEGENTEHSDGSIKVWFGTQVQLTPIISDAEYLLDQHILICVKSTDSDESYGEGCVALRAAQFCYTEFQVALTHHGENTGVLTGGIQLHTSEGKPTEKLYDFIKVERDDAKGKSGEPNKTSAGQAHDISNPSYMEVSYRSDNVIAKGWSYSLPPKTLPIARQPSKDSKKSPTGKPVKPADVEVSKMFDNPLYGSTRTSPIQGKDQEALQKNHLMPPDPMFGPKLPEGPPVPTPRSRSFTCSESKPALPAAVAQYKKPVVPSRSQGCMPTSRPPLPAKARPGPAELQAPKPRDYRDISELPGKQQAPARPGLTQSQKDRKGDHL